METPSPKKRSATAVLAIVCLCLCAVLAVVIFLSRPYRQEDPELTASQPPTEEITEPPTDPGPTLPPPDPNPYGKLDFQYDGFYLKSQKGPSVPGIDVSAYQGEVDWEQVKEAGIQFAIVRLGFRGYETGKMVEDKYARQNLEGAIAAGLDVGAYFFSQAISPEEAEEEAALVLDILGDQKLTMPVVFDWEFVNSEARTAKVDSRTLTDSALRFLSVIDEAGYWPMMYFNTYMSRHNLHLAELKQYDFWLALYSDRMTFPYEIQMWQYSCTGRVPGIEGDVDLNVYFPDLIKTRSHS